MCTECPDGVTDDYVRRRDAAFDQLLAPWDGQEERPTVSDGYVWWTSSAPMAQAVYFLRDLVSNLQEQKDLIVLETGIGQGYITRTLAPLIRAENDLYWCYESHDEWRVQLSIRDFWVVNLTTCLKNNPTPDYEEMVVGDLVIVDSDSPFNKAEFYLWEAVRPFESLLFWCGPKPETNTQHLYATVGGREYRLFGEDVFRFSDLWSAFFEQFVLVG